VKHCFFLHFEEKKDIFNVYHTSRCMNTAWEEEKEGEKWRERKMCNAIKTGR
jgi:hypothetical protein